MVEFDENLNPIQGGQPTAPSSDESPSRAESLKRRSLAQRESNQPIEPVQPVVNPEHSREKPPFETTPTPPPPPVDSFVATPPPPPQMPSTAQIAEMPSNPPPVKQASSGIIIALSIIAILAATTIAIVSIVSSNNSSFVISSGPIEGLTVMATGTVDAIPDVAKVTFGITHKASTVDKVEDEINSAMDSIADALNKFKIKDEDIKTSSYRIYPEYDYRSKTRRIIGYSGTHQQIITIRNLDDVNDIVDTVTDAGANTVGNVTFTVDDEEEWNSKARAEAIEKAKDKAKMIADEANIKLGKIVSIDQSISYPPIFRGMTLDAEFDEDSIGKVSPLPNIEPGSQEIRATVTLVYEIK